MSTRIRLVVATAVLASLAGCSTIVGKKESIALYAPEATVQPDAAWPQVQWALQIPRPHASELLDSPRIVVRPADGELQVYHGAIWAEPAPDLVQDAVLRAFEDSGRIGSVARRGSGVTGDYELLLDIRNFQSDYAGGATPKAEVEIVAKLIANRTDTVIATRMLKQHVPAASTKIGDVSRAFEAALTATVQDLVGWTLVEGQKYDIAHPAPAKPVKR
ncbi:ABC-type transport auxiliary lipoprotein family protein [Lysobacter sp. 2RAF19]